ncbi:hypothetical protein D9M68_248290 [compost metagenome]
MPGEVERTVAGDGAAGPLQVTGIEGGGAIARVLDVALAVIEHRGGDREVAARAEGAIAAVVQSVEDVHRQGGLLGGDDGTALVAQAARLHRGVAGGDELAVVVVELAGDGHLAVAGAGRLDFAALVGERAGLEVECAVAGDGAAGVVHPPAGANGQLFGAAGGDGAAGIGQGAGVYGDALGLGGGACQVGGVAGDAQGAVAGDGAGLAAECVGGDVQGAVAGVLDDAFAVVQGGGGHLHVAARGERALDAVVEQAVHIDGERGIIRCSDGAALVEQVPRLHGGVAGSDQLAASVVELAVHGDARGVAAGSVELAASVGECFGLQVQCAVTGDGATAVVHAVTGTYEQQVGSRSGHGAADVGQGASVDVDAFGLGGSAGQVGGAAGEAEGAVAGDGAGLAVEGVGGDVQGAVAGVLDGALAVVQSGGGYLHVAAGGQGALGAVVEQAAHADGERGVARRRHGAALVEQVPRRHPGVAGGDQLACAVVELARDLYLAVGGTGGADRAVLVAE